jgi:hypothetical protein
MSEPVPNLDLDVDGQKSMWQKIKVITLDKQDSNIIEVQYSDNSSALINLAVKVTSTRSSKTRLSSESMFHLPEAQPLYRRKDDVQRLSASKHNSLMKLCT